MAMREFFAKNKIKSAPYLPYKSNSNSRFHYTRARFTSISIRKLSFFLNRKNTTSKMPELMITGKRTLEKEIKISGSKNAVLPLMAASLLTNEKVTLTNVPDITDVDNMKYALEAYGVTVDWKKSKKTLKLEAERPTSTLPSSKNVGELTRASILVLGPLLARTGSADVHRPGGCPIAQGGRKVDFHIQAMEKMGAELIKENGVISMTADNGLQPATITFKKSSVGATENAMMAASLVEGKTVIRHAAIEPEIRELANMLVKMGAKITIEEDVQIVEKITQFETEVDIERWNVITINGCKSLSGATYEVMPDRIEFGTYAIAAAITNGKIVLEIKQEWEKAMLTAIEQPLRNAGVKIKVAEDRHHRYRGIEISLENGKIFPVDIQTGPYPRFPTDLLPQWVTFMTQARATRAKKYTTIYDNIYDDRFKYVDGLKKMGADEQIEEISKKEYRIYATEHEAKLKSARVEATDIRGGAALVLAGLVADGSTVVRKFEYIKRGYEDMVGKLNKCNAKLEIIEDPRPGFHGGVTF